MCFQRSMLVFALLKVGVGLIYALLSATKAVG